MQHPKCTTQTRHEPPAQAMRLSLTVGISSYSNAGERSTAIKHAPSRHHHLTQHMKSTRQQNTQSQKTTKASPRPLQVRSDSAPTRATSVTTDHHHAPKPPPLLPCGWRGAGAGAIVQSDDPKACAGSTRCVVVSPHPTPAPAGTPEGPCPCDCPCPCPPPPPAAGGGWRLALLPVAP